MFLVEPPPTRYDVHFSVAGVPIRIHPFFWLMCVILGSRSAENNPNAGTDLLIWVVVVLVSILIHELGHAFAMRYFGEAPRVVLYMMGGLATADRQQGFSAGMSSSRNSNSQILISAAGPFAGFLLAGFTITTIIALGGVLTTATEPAPGWYVVDIIYFLDWYIRIPGETSRELVVLFGNLLWVNIFWGILNLLPVFPLDGGQIARELLSRRDPHNGTVASLWLSFFTAMALAVGGWIYLGSFLMALMFGSLAYSSYKAIQQFGGGGFGGRPW